MVARALNGESLREGKKRAIVIFDSRSGSTETIARALGEGLEKAGIDVSCVNARDVQVGLLDRYQLISIGAPTEAFSASKTMKDLLGRLKRIDLSGTYGFAFDTRIEWRLSGGAAKFIEKHLERMGTRIIAPRESAMISSIRNGGEITGAQLHVGEKERFEQLGFKVGTTLIKEMEAIPA